MRRRRNAKGLRQGCPQGLLDALAALYGSAPLTPDEKARFRQQLSDVRAEDERRREQAEADLFHEGREL